ncbi:hypothetical protein CVIRNUC_006107 [Coccomyxa viridis]|uniref:Protein kinase domain-containing protein n=1 Tax=Coccomyxa viridis TaxID=1274662 RepID=A0AAV1I7B5_9CHLO|nr:hypothetical protein CVIRNUC_006107 [Coccomyxa viridis]
MTALPVRDAVSNYEKISRIGEGTYGVVYKARDRTTGEVVALKQVRMERERDGIPVTSMREIRVLQQCRHPNIVHLKKVVTGSKPDSIFLVFEYCTHDLGQLVDAMPRPFSPSEVKCLMLQLLEAVNFLHSHWIMSRDLKLPNLLLTNSGQLKICDFGLARYFHTSDESYTPKVVTLWYRAPEIFLGQDAYTEAIDMWAVGCIFGELLRNEPLFPGRSEAEMLERMVRLLGSPHENIWPGFTQLPEAGSLKFPSQPYNFVAREFPNASVGAISLLKKLLMYDPGQRLSARAALRHGYFQEQPPPKQPADFPTFPSAHDTGLRQRHQRRAEMEQQEDMHRHRQPAKRSRAQQEAEERFGEAFGTQGGQNRGHAGQKRSRNL